MCGCMAVDLQDLGLFGGVPTEFQPLGYTPNYGPQTSPYTLFSTGMSGEAYQKALMNAQKPNKGAVGFANEFLFGTTEGAPIFQSKPGVLDAAGFGTVEKIALILGGVFLLSRVVK